MTELELDMSHESFYGTKKALASDWLYRMSLEDFEVLVELIEGDFKFVGWNAK
jgi:hypothetical protein